MTQKDHSRATQISDTTIVSSHGMPTVAASRTYDILLQQASQSADLLYCLCRSYRDQTSATTTPSLRPSASNRTGSCEA